jgi:hypothetical protein
MPGPFLIQGVSYSSDLSLCSIRSRLANPHIRAVIGAETGDPGAARRLGDRLDYLTGRLLLTETCNVGLRKHPDQFVLANDNRDSPHLRPRHQP